jgi:hypothetical protein
MTQNHMQSLLYLVKTQKLFPKVIFKHNHFMFLKYHVEPLSFRDSQVNSECTLLLPYAI